MGHKSNERFHPGTSPVLYDKTSMAAAEQPDTPFSWNILITGKYHVTFIFQITDCGLKNLHHPGLLFRFSGARRRRANRLTPWTSPKKDLALQFSVRRYLLARNQPPHTAALSTNPAASLRHGLRESRAASDPAVYFSLPRAPARPSHSKGGGVRSRNILAQQMGRHGGGRRCSISLSAGVVWQGSRVQPYRNLPPHLPASRSCISSEKRTSLGEGDNRSSHAPAQPRQSPR